MKSVIRQSLGRAKPIGAVYDLKTDSFQSGNLFHSMDDLNYTFLEAPNTSIDFSFEDSASDKFSNLHISAELKLSVMAGLFTLEGSGKYFNDEKQSKKTVKAVLRYSFVSGVESVDPFRSQVDFNSQIFSGKQRSTHVVDLIKYGANVNVVFETQISDVSQKVVVEGKLAAELKKAAVGISGSAAVDYSQSATDFKTNFNIKIFGDIEPPEKIPTTIEEVVTFLKNVPTIVAKSTNNRGVPLEYQLCPLSALKGSKVVADAILQSIAMSELNRIENSLNEITDVKQKLHDFQQEYSALAGIAILGEDTTAIDTLVNGFSKFQSSYQEKARTALEYVRGNRPEGPQYLLDLKNLYDKSIDPPNCTAAITQLTVFSKKYQAQLMYFNYLIRIGIEFVPAALDYSLKISQTLEKKIFILFYSENFHKENDDIDQENADKFMQNTGLFINLKKSPQYLNDTKFYIVNLDLHPKLAEAFKLADTCIHYYEKRILISKNYLEMVGENMHVIYPSKTHIQIEGQAEKPENYLSMPTLIIRCPQSLNFNKCSPVKREWKCSSCNDQIHFEIKAKDVYFYCKCFTFLGSQTLFKCGDLNHGIDPIDFKNQDDFTFLLKQAPGGKEASDEVQKKIEAEKAEDRKKKLCYPMQFKDLNVYSSIFSTFNYQPDKDKPVHKLMIVQPMSSGQKQTFADDLERDFAYPLNLLLVEQKMFDARYKCYFQLLKLPTNGNTTVSCMSVDKRPDAPDIVHKRTINSLFPAGCAWADPSDFEMKSFDYITIKHEGKDVICVVLV